MPKSGFNSEERREREISCDTMPDLDSGDRIDWVRQVRNRSVRSAGGEMRFLERKDLTSLSPKQEARSGVRGRLSSLEEKGLESLLLMKRHAFRGRAFHLCQDDLM
jgi:hypothetical protein